MFDQFMMIYQLRQNSLNVLRRKRMISTFKLSSVTLTGYSIIIYHMINLRHKLNFYNFQTNFMSVKKIVPMELILNFMFEKQMLCVSIIPYKTGAMSAIL